MSRTLTSATKAAISRESTSGVFPLLIRIDYGAGSFYFCNNYEDLTFGGQVYTAYPFTFDPPDEDSESIGNATITIDNVDRTIIAVLRTLTAAPTVTTIATFWNDEGGVVFDEVARWTFTMRKIRYDAQKISAELVYEDTLDNRYPGLMFTPFEFPGVH